jgi:AcrR family transcriptional regulator
MEPDVVATRRQQDRRQQEIEEARERILDAAARTLADGGVRAGSMQRIAAAAGYTAPTLYSYFRGKQAIVDALAARMLSEIEDLFEVVLAEGLSLRQGLEILLRHQHAWAESRREDFVFLVLRGGADEVSGRPRAGIDVQQRHIERLSAWLTARAAPGELGPYSPDVAARSLWALGNAYFLSWMSAGATGSFSDVVPEILDLFFFGVRGPEGGAPRAAATSSGS